MLNTYTLLALFLFLLVYTPFLSAFALCSCSYSHPHLSPCLAKLILPTLHGKIELISARYIFQHLVYKNFMWTSIKISRGKQKEINNIPMSQDTSQLKKKQYATSNTKHMMAINRPGHLVPNACPALGILLSLGSWALPPWQISKTYHCLFAYVLCRLLLSSNRNI